MRRRRRSYAGQEWANADVVRVLWVVVPLALGVYEPFFFVVAAVALVVHAVRFAVHVRRRRARERAGANAPFWADRIKE